MMNKELSASLKLYQDALVWDAHAGVFPNPDVDLNFISAWQNSGVNYLSVNVGFDVMDWQQTLATLAAFRRFVLNQPDHMVLVNKTADIDQAITDRKFAISFDIEGMNALNDDINMVSVYHGLGVRQMLFAYNLNNAAAGGCHDRDKGLTSFGEEVVTEMNRLGILVDCSHAGCQTTMDIMHLSSCPVVFSHSNPFAVWQHQRNITDEQIIACANTGGVIGMNGMGIFLGDNDISNETLLRHIQYVADLTGPQHIGLGLDYSPDLDLDIGDILQSRPDFWPAGQQYDTKGIKHASPDQLQDLTAKLCASGFSDTDVRGILGENFKRVAKVVWG